uniref:Uncharacterized protein n=1 Tax=Strombidium rassoulzadegani TaxID=1082188 RepID=A0A7S3CQV2_9SPIT
MPSATLSHSLSWGLELNILVALVPHGHMMLLVDLLLVLGVLARVVVLVAGLPVFHASHSVGELLLVHPRELVGILTLVLLEVRMLVVGYAVVNLGHEGLLLGALGEPACTLPAGLVLLLVQVGDHGGSLRVLLHQLPLGRVDHLVLKVGDVGLAEATMPAILLTRGRDRVVLRRLGVAALHHSLLLVVVSLAW